MQPIGLLMREHRLIEQILPLLENEMKWSSLTSKVDAMYINTAIDFFQIYASLTHYGNRWLFLYLNC
jgi:hemerythrin-like domain-containing protein